MDILTGMRTYAAVVSTGSFTGAAERLGISRALTSKYVGQLEDHLGVRLLNRTTRQLNVTEVGQAYFERCRQIVDEIDELESAVSDQQTAPRGRLLIAAPTTFGEMFLAQAVARYLGEYPEVSIELVLADRFVNLVDEGFDLAVRIGNLKDSSLIARRLASCRIVVCASPEYLQRAGSPTKPDDLERHCCIYDTNQGSGNSWPFRDDDHRFRVNVKGNLRVNGAVAVREAMLAGHGVGYSPAYAIGEELRTGKLEIVLENYESDELGIYAVYPHNRHLATKVRSFIDFLITQFKAFAEWDNV
jgi:DNA-binding transcriptional LysR family regulator